ncbi:MAG: GspH/FimT family pseudopilin [Desulfobulbaceae bacterium]|jgi:prepilin-type N-terminal cleavage/methylation domain-containing protein|nr:GspH/FimT family pseudopilin [Desulfobulbaceae bacterium]
MTDVKKNINGFTLVEAMAVVALIAIIGVIAIPALMQARLNSDLRAAAYEIMGGIEWAKSEAAKRNVCVGINYDPATFIAPANAHNTDYQIFLDDNCNGIQEAGESVLRAAWLKNKANITWNLPPASPRSFRISPRGLMNKQPGNIQLMRGDSDRCYRLTVGRTAGVKIAASRVSGGGCP